MKTSMMKSALLAAAAALSLAARSVAGGTMTWKAGGSFAPEFSFDTASRLVSVKMNARCFTVIVR